MARLTLEAERAVARDSIVRLQSTGLVGGRHPRNIRTPAERIAK